MNVSLIFLQNRKLFVLIKTSFSNSCLKKLPLRIFLRLNKFLEGRGGGLVASVAFYSDNPSLNPVDF